jgi:ethanolamine utilization protein EutA
MEFAWSRERLKLHEDIFDHDHFTPEQSAALEAYIESQESLVLKTVGIDIGSSTSHLLFAKIVLQREAQELSSRYAVVRREIVWRSPIMLTPFTAHGTIDAEQLGAFIAQCYDDAGVAQETIDSGAVILTGEAIKRSNAEAIDELFAEQAGKFVCATAGHQLEATLTAHGSGAVAYSQHPDKCVLHVDIGGGTTKLALIDGGVVLDVCAFAVGGRLIAADEYGDWTRIDDSALLIAADLGIPATPESFALPETRQRIASRLADIAMDVITDSPLDALARSLMLTPPLQRAAVPVALTFSGGVAEYIFKRQAKEFGDVAPLLAAELRQRFRSRLSIPVVDPGGGIRATVIGASQFSVQVSGKTIYVSNGGVLPLRNVPVIRFELPPAYDPAELGASLRNRIERLDLATDAVVALAFAWTQAPEYAALLAVCRAIEDGVSARSASGVPLMILIDGDVGNTVGRILREELGLPCELISIDGVDLRDFDFVDAGAMVSPPGVIPLVIKSLIFR